MRTNGWNFPSDVKHPTDRITNNLEYERAMQITEFGNFCEITDVELGLESKYKRRSLDILQVILDTTNGTLSPASRQAWKRYENQTAVKRQQPHSQIRVKTLSRDPLQDLMAPWEVSAGVSDRE